MVLFDLGSDFVTPSWLPLAMAGGLLVVLGLLYLSLRHHLRKIDLPDEATTPASPDSPPVPPS